MKSFASAALPHTHLLGTRVHVLPRVTTLAVLEALIADGSPAQVVTVNPEFLVRAVREPAYRRVLNRAKLSTIDGIGVALALRYLRRLPSQRLTGVDLSIELGRIGAGADLPLFLLGGAPGVADEAAAALERAAPGLLVAGATSGSPSPEADVEMARHVSDSGARILLVAFGSPQQEYWIARNLHRLGPCVAVGVGGTFDYLAGRVPRAPMWTRHAGLEWLYRLIRQPWRWRRQLALPLFVYLVLREQAACRVINV